jgi:hypothetical protein
MCASSQAVLSAWYSVVFAPRLQHQDIPAPQTRAPEKDSDRRRHARSSFRPACVTHTPRPEGVLYRVPAVKSHRRERRHSPARLIRCTPKVSDGPNRIYRLFLQGKGLRRGVCDCRTIPQTTAPTVRPLLMSPTRFTRLTRFQIRQLLWRAPFLLAMLIVL